MNSLYTIEQNILDCIDTETGEILDTARLNRLQMERSNKIRNIACLIKNLQAEARSYEDEEKSFCQRKISANNKATRLKEYLSAALNGEKINATEFSIGWRKSQQVQIATGAEIPSLYHIPVPDKIDKIGLKTVLRNGKIIPGITLIEKNNIQIK